MIFEKIPLRADDEQITLTAYVADAGSPVRDAILVIPGGGYGCVCSDREGEPIALAYLAAGVNAFVLHYSVGEKALYPRPLVDASLAMLHIRNNAEKYHIDPNRIFAVGFSAGGHLAGALGTLWHLDSVKAELDAPYGANKPTGVILCYPVITGLRDSHPGSFYNILGTKEPTREQLALYSLEQHVDEKTVPTFLMHTANDVVVPVENSLCMAEALSKAKRPFELHIYPDAPHGVALGNWITECGRSAWVDSSIAQWVGNSIEWMKKMPSVEA